MAKKKKSDIDEDGEEIVIDAETKEKAADTVLFNLRKKYGAKSIMPLSSYVNTIKTVSTGSIALDIALGRGGIALGKIYEIFGQPASGKSTLGTHVIVQAQRQGLKCAYLDIEQTVDDDLFASYGVDSAKLYVVNTYTGESYFDILEELIKTGTYSVVVIDSVSALISVMEAEGDMGKQLMAPQARLMSTVLRKLGPQAAKQGVALLFINQLRSTLSMYGQDVTSGGKSLGFYATGRISVKGPESKERRILDADGDVIGHKLEISIVKNKLAPPHGHAEVRLIYGQGFDHYWDVLEQAVDAVVIEHPKGSSWYKYKGEPLGQGETAALDKLRSDPGLFNNIRTELLDTIGLKDIYVKHGNPSPLYTNLVVPTIAS